MINSVHHIKLDISDVERSLDFYCGALGFKTIVQYDLDGGNRIIIQVSPDGNPPGIELWYEPPHEGLKNDRLHIALDVSDTEGLVRRLKKNSIFVEREPFHLGHEIIAFIRDPDGYLIEINQDTNRNP